MRRRRGWKSEYRPDADVGNDFIGAVLLLSDHGYQLRVRGALAALTAPVALGIVGRCCIAVAGLSLLWDAWRICQASAPSRLPHAHTNSDYKVIHPEVVPQHWVVFEGAMCASYYYAGLLHGIYERFGKEQFADLGVGYSGASSGGHAAGYAGAAVIHGPYDGKHWAMTHMAFPPKLWQLLPLGMLFAAGLGLKESGMWGFRTVNKFPRISESLAGGSYLMWLLHPYCSSRGVRFWRRVVKCTPTDVELFGDECAATGMLPMLMPCLAWPCHGFALDGFLNLAVSETIQLKRPALADPKICPGRHLVITTTRGQDPCLPAGSVGINVSRWRKFSLWSDYLMHLGMSCGDHPGRLFSWGVDDAYKHGPELDAAIEQVFGLFPRSSSSL